MWVRPSPPFYHLVRRPTRNSPELYHKPILHSPEICKHLVMWTPRGPFISPCCKHCGGVIYEITECWPDFHKYSTKRGVRKFQACPKQGWLMGAPPISSRCRANIWHLQISFDWQTDFLQMFLNAFTIPCTATSAIIVRCRPRKSRSVTDLLLFQTGHYQRMWFHPSPIRILKACSKMLSLISIWQDILVSISFIFWWGDWLKT